MTTKFKSGDLVWAKQRYYPAWPAKVIDPPAGSNKKNSYYVYFYGSENFGWIKKHDICSYKTNIKVLHSHKSAVYRKAVQTIASIYHEEVQLNSPTFKKFYKKEADTDDEVQNSPKFKQGCLKEVEADDEVQQNDYEVITRPKRTEEEEEARRKKIQERLKVRLFPKKNKRTRKQRKPKKVSEIEDAEYTIPSPSSCIPSSSSCIITVHVSDFRKVIPYEAVVLLQRCDEGLPSLTVDSEEAEPESASQEDQPPTLLPEL